MSGSVFKDVDRFNQGAGVLRQNLTLAVNLLGEEVSELSYALLNQNRVASVDAVMDVIYTAVQVGLALHVTPEQLDRAWAEVQRSNMDKVQGEGLPVFDAKGKITKPEGWTPPDIKGAIDA